VAGYLPLCAFRQGLLPDACGSCVWWLTTGETGAGESASAGPSSGAAEDIRRPWIASLEDTWGMPGLLLECGGTPPDIAASIQFAPADLVPRLQDLPFARLPEGSALLFCLTCASGQPRYQARRVLQKALRQLKGRGISEAYGVASSAVSAEKSPRFCGPPDGDSCRFFQADFLLDTGFELARRAGGLLLMRMDLRGALSLVGQLTAAIREALRDNPAPSPAAWSRHEA